MNEYFSSAEFTLTENCQLNCKYCYIKQQNNTMSREIAQKGVNFLFNGAIKNNERIVNIGFFGGEPTLNVSLMEYILDYAYYCSESIKASNKIEISPSFELTSNGMNWTSELFKFLEKWYKKEGHMHIQLSYDGIPEVQDMNRITKDGSPSSTIMENNLQQIKDWALENKIDTWNNFTVHFVVTKETLPFLSQSYRYFIDQGFPVWHLLLPEEKWNDEDAIIYEKELLKIKKYITEKNSNLFDQLTSFHETNPTCGPTCGAGRRFCNIATDGRVYACHRIAAEDPDNCLGSVDKDGHFFIDKTKKEIYELLDSKEFLGEKVCGECESASNCYRCIAANMSSNILPSLCFPEYCKMTHIEQKIFNQIKPILIEQNIITEDSKPDIVINNDIAAIVESFNQLVTGISDTNITIAEGLETLQTEIEAIRIQQNELIQLIVGMMLKNEQ